MHWVLSEGVTASQGPGKHEEPPLGSGSAGRRVEEAPGRGGSRGGGLPGGGAPERRGKGRGVREWPVAGQGQQDRTEPTGPASPRESLFKQ